MLSVLLFVFAATMTVAVVPTETAPYVGVPFAASLMTPGLSRFNEGIYTTVEIEEPNADWNAIPMSKWKVEEEEKVGLEDVVPYPFVTKFGPPNPNVTTIRFVDGVADGSPNPEET